jgi:hypothetical protein
MNVSRKLALAYAWRNPARMLLTSLATIASACVVVWVVSGYDASVGQCGSKATEYLGRYDLFLVPDSAEDSSLPAELVAALNKDSAVAQWEPALQWTVRVKSDKSMDLDMEGNSGSKNGPPTQGGGTSGHHAARPRTARNSSAPAQPRLPIRWPRDAGSRRTTLHSVRRSSAISRQTNSKSGSATKCS